MINNSFITLILELVCIHAEKSIIHIITDKITTLYLRT